MTQEADRLQVFASAVDVGYPLAGLAAVVPIEHRGDRIDTQPVDMEMLEPVQRARDQESLHLATAEIVDQCIPVAVEAFARILMLIKRGAVEAHETVRIIGEMRRPPIENDPDA